MASDINSYALNVEFALADQATPQLDVLDQRLGKVEEQVNNLGMKALNNVNLMFQQINTNLVQWAQQADKIHQTTLSSIKPIKDASSLDIESQKRMEIEEAATTRILKTFDDIVKKISNKNGLIDQESKALEKERGQVTEVGKGFLGWGDNIRTSGVALGGFGGGLRLIKEALKEARQASEMFKNANFRLFGTQSELMGQANQLALQYGVMRQEALAAMVALGNLKVPTEMMGKLVEVTVKFNRLSGVSVQQTADWSKHLLALGLSASDIERRLGHMAIAMRRYGLDTQEVSGLMRTRKSPFFTGEPSRTVSSMISPATSGEIFTSTSG